MKSANILLNDNWNAKVSDFGLSIMGPANEQQSVIITFAAGTPGYCDPQYAMTHTLTKESDVYSFGVVLFEVLCGTLCCAYSNGRVEQNLVPKWIESYKQKQLYDIIYKNPTIQPLNQISLEIFSTIAFRCLKPSREDRPKMVEVVTELETALEIQELSKGTLPRVFYQETPPRNYSSKAKLWKLLSEGVLLNDDKTWFSVNKKGEHCEMISFVECLDPGPNEYNGWLSAYNSRFAMGTYCSRDGIFKTHVKTQFLSPGITYTVNLVFKIAAPDCTRKNDQLISLKYKLQGELETSVSHLAYKREDGWWMCEMYQFTSDRRIDDLKIMFDGFNTYASPFMAVEGVEFWPLEEVEHKEDEKQPVSSDLKGNWEEKMPIDYEDIMKRSKNSVQWTTRKEAYSIICKGFLISDGKKRSIWFYLDKNGKKCHILSARLACRMGPGQYPLSLPESRFGEAFQSHSSIIYINTEIQSQLLSTETMYAAYLVYKLPKDQSGFEVPVLVEDRQGSNTNHYWYIYLVSPQTPVVRPMASQNTHRPTSRPKINGLPQQRNDGWMEVQIWKFRTSATTEMIHMRLMLTHFGANKTSWLTIQGVECRPI